jgi:hypothetical protein
MFSGMGDGCELGYKLIVGGLEGNGIIVLINYYGIENMKI